MCPGKKFAQVEVLAVLVSLFRKHRVKPAMLEGETLKEAESRVRKELDNSRVTVTLGLNNPERIKLIWEEVK